MKILEQENDFLKREIQKLTVALMKLIDKTVSTDVNSFEAVIFENNEKLDEYLGLSINKIVKSEDSELKNKVENFQEVHLEKLIDLLYQTSLKAEEFGDSLTINNNELIEKLLVLIEVANKKSNSFSVERMNMKTKLINIKNSNKE